MPSAAPHPLEAKFVKLALLKQWIKPTQLRHCHQRFKERLSEGEAITLEEVLQQEGLLTEDECEELWEWIARSADTKVRQQLSARAQGRRKAAAGHVSDRSSEQGSRWGEMPGRIGGYEIREWIGKGGMGKVYKAWQVAMEREVALKLLPPELAADAKYIRRFIREARAAGLINHGNLVRVHDVGECDGRYYISMEYVEGRTVQQILRREGRVAIVESLKIAEQVSAALACAHQKKIVHRDIKPDNIMITPKGVAKLCDLGLAKALPGGPLQDSDTQDGQTMGTPYYMSPEQAKAGAQVDGRSDLFSLGATLYHMVTGRVPFEGDSAWEVLTKVLHEEPTRPERLEPLLPPPYARLIRRLLAKDPAERPRNAEEVHRELRALRNDLEAGRVFAFDDAPRALSGHPVPGPRARNVQAPLHRRRLLCRIGLGAALIFLAVCAAIRGLRPARAAPLPPSLALRGQVPEVRPSEPGTKRKTVAKHTAGTPAIHLDANRKSPPGRPDGVGAPRTAPRLDGALLRDWERRFQTEPRSWPLILAGLEQAAAKGLAVAPKDQARFQALRAKLWKRREEDAVRALEDRRFGAAALMRAGLMRRASRLMGGLPPFLRRAPSVQGRIQEEHAKIRRAAKRDAEARAAEIESLLRDGLFRLASQTLEAWDAELREDGVPKNDERAAALQAAAERAGRAYASALAKETAWDQERQALQQELQRVRQRSARNDPFGALELCNALLVRARTETEKQAYAAEQARLQRAAGLFTRLARAISGHPRRISERDFRPQARLTGRLKGMDRKHLVIEWARGEANVPLSTVSRREMRRLFRQVFDAASLTDDDPLGRLAYDLGEEARAPGARLRLARLARLADGGNPDALALARKLLEADRAKFRARGRELLVRAEAWAAGAHYEASQRTVAAALSALSQAGDDKLSGRAQRLLRWLRDARTAGAVYGGTSTPRPRGRTRLDLSAADLTRSSGDWIWQGAAPVLPGGGPLAFGALLSEAAPSWMLFGPAYLMMDVLLPEKSDGAIVLRATSAAPAGLGLGARPERWSLKLEAAGAGPRASLVHGGVPEPPWSRVRLRPGVRQRLWLRLDIGQVRWGVNERVLETRPASPAVRWRVKLLARGAARLYGLRVVGRIKPKRTPAEREKEGERIFALTQAALGLARVPALKLVLARYGQHARLASRICAALARYYREAGQVGTGHYWAARALYECPREDWPDETRRLEGEHRAWELARAERGWPPLDPRKGPGEANTAPPTTARQKEKPPQAAGPKPPNPPPPAKRKGGGKNGTNPPPPPSDASPSNLPRPSRGGRSLPAVKQPLKPSRQGGLSVPLGP